MTPRELSAAHQVIAATSELTVDRLLALVAEAPTRA